MSDLKMKQKLETDTELSEDIKAANKRMKALPLRVDDRASLATSLAREDSDAPGPPQLNTGGGPLPLRTIPMCEFCYLNMRPTDTAEYCLEHDIGGHVRCKRLHETTVHQ